MKVSQAGIDLIKRFEGCKLEAYQDIAQVWTIGYGSTLNVRPGMCISQEQADERLAQECQVAVKCVNASVSVPVTQNQFDALVSFTFNLGCGSLRSSTLLRKLNAGEDDEAADQFLRWDHANGIRVAGLTARRVAERDLFIRSDEAA